MNDLNTVHLNEPTTVISLLRRQREHFADHAAIWSPDKPSLSYQQLYKHVQQNVSLLRRAGIGRQDRVAVVLPNGADMAVALLSVTSAAACAPLNPAYQAQELRFYLQDLGVKAVLVAASDKTAASEVAEELGLIIIKLASLDAESGVFDMVCENNVLASDQDDPDSHDVALLLHTSGTTSTPKLVPLTQHNILTSAQNIATTLLLSPQDRCLNMMPLFHIHGLVAAMLSTLKSGGGLICTGGYQQADFFVWLRELQPSWYSAVPTIHQSILALAELQPDQIQSSRLRFIRSSSAAMPASVMEKTESLFGVPVIEAYGMTEAAHQMASNPLPPAVRKSSSVGRAAGPEVAIMDAMGNLLPVGITGEVVIRGENVTAGYEHNPQANADNFTNGWFRTGDQGRLDEEGYLFLSDRLKEIINRGGEKVSPREVDEAIMNHPDVRQAVTFAMPHVSLGEDVAAAVVLKQDSRTTTVAIRNFLFGRLTDYKIPSVIVIVDEIPKGSTGKLQRIGLAEKLADQLAQDYIAPANDIERMLATIWAEVLFIEKVGRHDNFFALGGDSLRATQVISRIRAGFQANLNIVVVFEKPTLAELAETVANAIDSDKLDMLSDMLGELENLTDEQAREMLSMEIKPRKK